MAAIRTRVSNQLMLLIQPLQHTRGLLGREPELTVSIPLQLCEIISQRVWLAFFTFLHLCDPSCASSELIFKRGCLLLVKNTSVPALGTPARLEASEISGQQLILLGTETGNFILPVHNHAQCRCLHPAG
ncbi:hypothetical protein D3C87_1667730 [compost metagenome]